MMRFKFLQMSVEVCNTELHLWKMTRSAQDSSVNKIYNTVLNNNISIITNKVFIVQKVSLT